MRLEDFAGHWRIDRQIEDRMGGQTGHFVGQAEFSPVAIGLAYHEEGWLTLGAGPRVRAVRDYVWRQEGGWIVVHHGDGRPFHSFDPAAPEAVHRCDRDDYRVRYDFALWPQWRADWTVHGPRKDYTMASLYTRPAG